MDEIKGYRVLVICFDPPIGKLIEHILARERHDKVRVAPRGHQGLAAAEQEPPSLIILGLLLPDLDGFEVYRRLRMIPALQNVPVLFQSADSRKSTYLKAQRLGAAGYVPVPFLIQDLLVARDVALRGDTYYPPLSEEPERPTVPRQRWLSALYALTCAIFQRLWKVKSSREG